MPIPAQAAIDSSRAAMTPKELRFPDNLGDFFMSLDFYDYRNYSEVIAGPGNRYEDGIPTEATRIMSNANRGSVEAAIQRGSFARIYLPIPSNLIDSNQVQWSAESLGLTAGILGEVWQGGAQALGSFGSDGIMQGSLNAFDTIKNGLTGTVMGEANESTVNHAARRVAALGMPLFGQITDLGTGVAENPNMAVLFRGPTLKQHTFSWRLMAKTRDESDTIRRIIATMKRAMAPQRLNSNTTAFLKYPSEAALAFHHPGEGGNSRWGNSKFLYQIRPSVIEDVIVNYAPHGAPAFMADDEASVAGLEIQLKLQETSYYLRDSYDTTEEFGSDGHQTSALRNPTGSDDDEDESP